MTPQWAIAFDRRSLPVHAPRVYFRCRGAVAQLGEHLVCNQGVVGSNPIRSTDSRRFFVCPQVQRLWTVSFMKRREAMRTACSLIAVLLAPVATAAQNAPPATPLRIAASSQATVEVHLNARRIGNQWYEEDASLSGPSRIAISYGQPHARGRKVEGGLIPVDTVWRFGANMATTLHTDLDITLGDVKLPRGDYSLFILYSRTGYALDRKSTRLN